jgi:protein-disulfide isomerase
MKGMRISAFGLTLVLLLSCQAANDPIDKGKLLGSQSAPMTLEIYSSFDCPHCKTMHETDGPLLMQDFVIPGKACIVSREFPLTGPAHPYAREAANYATAAARIGKYDVVSDTLFKNQNTWAINGKVWAAVAAVLTASEQAKVQSLAKDPTVLAEVQRDYDAGMAAGITSTPSTIIVYKGKRYPPLSGAQNYDLLKQYLNGLLAH